MSSSSIYIYSKTREANNIPRLQSIFPTVRIWSRRKKTSLENIFASQIIFSDKKKKKHTLIATSNLYFAYRYLLPTYH